MDATTAADLLHDALALTLVLAVPGLAVAFAVSLVAGFLQALTQIQDHALSAVPRLIVGLLALLCLVPWMLDRLTTYTVELYEGVATTL